MSDLLKQAAVAAKRIQRLAMRDCFDPLDPSSRPTVGQQAVLDDIGQVQFRYITAGNQSGKSATGAREVSWVLTETHPTWRRPVRWGSEPLQIIVAARTHKQIEENLWLKVRSYLDPSEYKEIKTGNQLQKVVHTPTGNTLLFLVHSSEGESRLNLEGFVAHYVWVDEMPKHVNIIEELQRRVQSKGGYFLATFTPKVRNDQIRRMVDGASLPHARKYTFRMFDNPVLTDADKESILQSLSTLSPARRATILDGAWSAGDAACFEFDPAVTVMEPAGYNRGWRHMICADPAISSKFGLTLWAEHPATGCWWCVMSCYIKGIQAPSDLVAEVEARCAGYNIVRRGYDSHEPWFAGQAHRDTGHVWMKVWNKAQRRDELVVNFRNALRDGKVRVAPWCQDLLDELLECSFDDHGRIVNATNYHCIDSALYFWDMRPKYDPGQCPATQGQALREAHRVAKARERSRVQCGRPGRVGRVQIGQRSRTWGP